MPGPTGQLDLIRRRTALPVSPHGKIRGGRGRRRPGRAYRAGELGGVLPLHKRAGRLQLGAFAVVCLGKQLLHHIGGGVAVNALGRKIVQNLAAGLALAQQLRGAAAGKRDIV